MTNFKFLKTLKDSPAPIVEAEKKFQTYKLETDKGTQTIAVPLELSEDFDTFLESKLNDLDDLEKHLSQFKAFII